MITHTYRIKRGDDIYTCSKCGKLAKLEESWQKVGDHDLSECKPVKRGKFGLPSSFFNGK